MTCVFFRECRLLANSMMISSRFQRFRSTNFRFLPGKPGEVPTLPFTSTVTRTTRFVPWTVGKQCLLMTLLAMAAVRFNICHWSCRYDEWVREVISECGHACKHIRVLPIFNATLPRFKMHHGSVGSNIMSVDCRYEAWWNSLYDAHVVCSRGFVHGGYCRADNTWILCGILFGLTKLLLLICNLKSRSKIPSIGNVQERLVHCFSGLVGGISACW